MSILTQQQVYCHQIVLLDQPVEVWSSWKLLLISFKLIKELENRGHYTEYKNNSNVQSFLFFANELKNNLSIPVGFHGHNNLGMAVANTIEAIKSGATIIDGTTRGFGAGAGNITQGTYAVAIGSSAGSNNQGSEAIAIGATAGGIPAPGLPRRLPPLRDPAKKNDLPLARQVGQVLQEDVVGTGGSAVALRWAPL